MDDVRIEFEEDHIRVCLAPDFEFDSSRSESLWQQLKHVSDEAERAGSWSRDGLEVDLDTSEVIAAGERTATVPKLWMAIHFEDFVPNEQSELFEVIAASKGVRVKHFTNREHALMWLRNNSPG